MRCKDFLKAYSDFRDGLIDDIVVHRKMKNHLASCANCAKHDRALNEGIRLLKETPISHTPSPSFRPYPEGFGPTPVPVIPAKIMAPLLAASLIAILVGRSGEKAEQAEQLAAAPATQLVVRHEAVEPMNMTPTVVNIAFVHPTTVRTPSRPIRVVREANLQQATQ